MQCADDFRGSYVVIDEKRIRSVARPRMTKEAGGVIGFGTVIIVAAILFLLLLLLLLLRNLFETSCFRKLPFLREVVIELEVDWSSSFFFSLSNRALLRKNKLR